MRPLPPDRSPRPVALRLTLGLLCVLVMFTLLALGTWQVRRLAWKQALIARVDARVHAPPVPVPPPAQWPTLDVPAEAYRHVQLSGHFLWNRTERIQASTELGPGYWLITPLALEDGHAVLVNRGFMADPGDERPPAAAALDQVTGLLRASEPGGRLFRPNQPGAHLWYSRDVTALATAMQLSGAAPFFVDADADPGTDPLAAPPPNRAIAGLTVITFPNNHLVYALTWFALAAMAAWGLLLLWREGDHQDE